MLDEKELEKRKEIIRNTLGYDNPKNLEIGDKIKVVNPEMLLWGNETVDKGVQRIFKGFWNNGDLKVHHAGIGETEIFMFWKKI